MSKESIEYGVMVDWPHASGLCGPVMTSLENAELRRDTIRSLEASLAKFAGVKPPPVRLVMRTCTPWCEVCADDPFKGKETT